MNNKQEFLLKLPLDSSPFQNNYWLAGFLDADGSFYIRFSEKHIICKFKLERSLIYPNSEQNYFTILNRISTFFNVRLACLPDNILNNKKKYYLIRIENHKSINLLISYLNKYPLLSSKYLDFLEWEKAFNEIINKTHYNEQGRKIILTAKNNMNNKRTSFNWNHLNFL